MNNDNGSVSYAVTLDHKQMNRDKQDVVNIFHEIGQEAQQQGEVVDNSFNSAAKNIGKAFAAIGIAATLKEFGTQIMKVRGEFQKLEVAFEVMLGSAKEADALMKQLTKTAATTPFDLKGVADGAKQLLAYGTAANEVNDMLIRLGNIASGLSIPLGDLVMLYGTTMTQGRMFTQDLRQFMGRGIPLADELAKQFGVAKDQVGELVTAGKVGAEEVKKAIESMTNEGGKFYGLMEKQSQTIAGQLSNLEDAIDSMFNSIGKDTQGMISAGISGVATLVENYETIGKILMTLVAAYGSYKAAIMMQTAVQAAHSAVEAEAALQMALAAKAGHTLSIEQARAAATSTLLAAAQTRLKASLSGLGATLTNPYVLATAAIVGMVYAVYKLATAESAQEKGVKAANDQLERQQQLLDERRQKIDSLIKTVQDSNATAVQQAEAYRELQSLAPSLTDKYSQQELATIDAAKAAKELNKQLDDTKYAQLQKNISDTEVRIKGLERQMQTAAAAATQGGSMTAAVIASQISKNQSALETYKKQLADYEAARRQAERENRPLDVKISDASKTLADAKAVFDKLEAEMQSEQEKVRENPWYQIPLQLIFDYNSAKKAYDDAERESKRLQGMTAKSHEQAQKDAMTEYNAAVAAEEAARKKSEVEWQAANKRLDEAKSGLKSVGIDIEAQQRKAQQQKTKAANDAKQAANEAAQRYEQIRSTQERIDQLMLQGEQDRKQKLLDMQNATEQAVINGLEDAGERERRQRELNNKLQIESLKKQKQDFINATLQAQKEIFDAQEDLKKAKDKNYRKQTFKGDAGSVDTSAYDNLIAQTEIAQQREANEQIRKSWNEYLQQYGTYQQQRLAITEEFTEKINTARAIGDEAAARMAEEQQNERLAQLEQKFGLAAQSMADLFADTSRKSVSEIDKIIKKYETLINFMEGKNGKIMDASGNALSTSDKVISQADLKSLGFTDDEIKKIQDGSISIKEVTERIRELKNVLKDKSAFQSFKSNLNETFNQFKKAKSVGDYGNAITSLAGDINSFLPSLKDFSSSLGTIFGFDDSKLQGIMDGLGGIATAGAGVGQMMSGDIVGGAMSAVQGIGQVVNALDGLFGADYSQYNAMVEEYNGLIDVWDILIDRKTEYLKISYGSEIQAVGKEALSLIDKEIEAYRTLGKERLNSGASMGSHSIGVRIRNGMSYEGWQELRKAAREAGFSYEEVADGRMTGLFDLSLEQLKKLQETAPTFWAKLDDDVRDYLNKIIDGSKRIEEMQDAIREQQTATTFDTIYDNFVSMLMDMESKTEDFSKDVSKMFMQAMLSNEIGKLYSEKLKSWYEKFATNMSDGTLSDSERTALQTEYEGYVKEAIRIRDELARVTGYDSSSSNSQEASRGGYETVSEETGTALLGRETAQLMQTTRLADFVIDQIPVIAQNQSLTMSLLEATNEFIFNCQTYLENISRNSNSLPRIESDLSKIKRIVEQNS